MADVTITCRENGPFLVTGPAKVIDHQGKTFNLGGKETFALCRCGHSHRRPFCDGAHKECGFMAGEVAE